MLAQADLAIHFDRPREIGRAATREAMSTPYPRLVYNDCDAEPPVFCSPRRLTATIAICWFSCSRMEYGRASLYRLAVQEFRNTPARPVRAICRRGREQRGQRAPPQALAEPVPVLAERRASTEAELAGRSVVELAMTRQGRPLRRRG